ncbi:hypothetical protein ACIP1T_25530 [Pseudomonas japonica]|uniref:hypothetical protein n=1 Tax=Pseudomonas TaxID=286 RepID=UPI0029281CD5|nr:hypothetical protein [Pseudomonas sp. zfem002]MDU9392569.1 hypothetical protein [Pseudomonas sp. zfem002]
MTSDNDQSLSISSAAVVESSLMAFGAGMSAQNRQDAKNAVLFATLAANRQFDQLIHSEEWFGLFLSVMRTCGWTTVHRTHEKEVASGQSLTVSNVVVEAVKVAASGLIQGNPVGQVFSSLAEQAIQGVSKDDKALTLFKRNLKQRSNVVVGLASCIETAQGEVVMALGAIQRSVRDEDLDVLVFDWHSASTTSYKGSAALSFNNQLYDGLRAAVEKKLGDKALTQILDYEI